MVSGDHAKGAEVPLITARVQEVCRVRYVEGVTVQFQNCSFDDSDAFLQAEIIDSVAGTVDLIPAKRSHARKDAIPRSIDRLDGGKSTRKRRRVEPMAGDALLVLNRSNQIGPIATRISAAC